MKKRIITGLLCGMLLMGTVYCGCGNKQLEIQNTETESQENTDSLTEDGNEKSALNIMQETNASLENAVPDDKYRTFYEMFLYSFYDGDGDGIGDFKGATEKLDYLNDADDGSDSDLGISGIWLMPIMPSPSYHKYDVTDYMNIDPSYGTLDDFKAFMEECNKRDIHVIIDLVMNHTSSEHKWFQEACSYLEALPEGSEPNSEECPYVDYYHFTKESKADYYQVGDTSWYYEGQFWSGMPDLNMENEAVIREFDEITDFWLSMGVSGFRLDAVGEYETGNVSKSTEILKQFVEEMKEKDSDIYLVGEIWTDMSNYTQYYNSGIDSCFDFSFADSTGIIASTLKGAKDYNASSFGKAQVSIQELIESINPEAIDAPFYTNHDLSRSAGYYSGENAEAQTKMAEAMNLLMSGNAFIYYGEELGMKGSGADEKKRAPMYWTEEKSAGLCVGPPDMGSIKMKYGSLEEQEKDGNSIYQFIKQVIKLRNSYQEIARGKVSFEESCSNDKICVVRKSYQGKDILIVYNLSAEEAAVDLSNITLQQGTEMSLGGVLVTKAEPVSFADKKLTLPAYSTVVID